MTPEQKHNLCAKGFRIYGGILLAVVILCVVAAICGVVALAIFALNDENFAAQMEKTKSEDVISILFGIVLFIVIFLAALLPFTTFGIFSLKAGRKMRDRKDGALISALTASILIVTHIPFGTAIAGYFLVFAFGNEGKEFYQNENFGSLKFIENIFKKPGSIA